ncbi:hypothetical protein HanLR1_Chr17g0670991 [Helianthus annuus]|nr:hypothetical protein HanHA89_Chr17g0712471 [Helianthus annuus]KAJ0632947.1 hypothetical protein HanLR1_Chr17g0670991 [Helianthus annuus]
MKQSSAPRSSITTSFFPAILDRNPKSVFPKTMMMLSSSAIVASIIDTSTAALSFHFDSFFQAHKLSPINPYLVFLWSLLVC